MALTQEQTTAQNFKDFYDRIRPLLNAQHYYVDRSGQELKSGEYTLSGNIPNSTSQNTKVTITPKTYGSSTKKNDFTIEDNTIIIPEGMTVKITTNMYMTPGASSEVNIEFRVKDYQANIDLDYATATYFNVGYSRSGSWSTIYTAPTGGAKIGLRCTYSAGARNIHEYSRILVEEIGRVVDPVQYVSSGDNLEETPVGNIISYMGNNVPPHYLACDGTVYHIGTYPELEAHFITEFGSINYFGGDGTNNWAVPDLRGEFLRGTGTNSHENQGSGENVGVHQNSTEFPNLGVGSTSSSKYGINAYKSNGTTEALLGNKKDSSFISSAGTVKVTSPAVTSPIATSVDYDKYTARPTNTSVQYCIKYENTYHVIVPSHAYKVSVGASIAASTNSEVAATLNNSDIVGDISLVSGNYLVAPVDGWYSIGCNWTCHGSFDQDYYFEINGTGLSASKQIGLSNTLYLSKGDKVRIIKYNGAANEGRINFCLLTSNVHENIIAGGDVYSEEEQVIGTWTDGKPLYQRVYIINTPTANTYYGVPFEASIDKCVSVNAEWFWGDGSTPVGTNEYAIDVWTTNNAYTHATYQPNYIYGKTTMAGNYIVAIAKYTKTTDQANTYTYKNSLLLTRPDLWTENTEIDFGGGLYGYRATGNMPAIAANANTVRVTLFGSLSGTSTIINYGGSVHGYNSSNKVVNVPVGQALPRQNEALAVKSIAGLFVTGGAGIVLEINMGDLYTTTANTYDIWFTYKK